MLTLENCRHRQKRLLKQMEKLRLDLVVLANPKTIYYFTGALTDPMLPQTFALNSAGKSLLITNQQPTQASADQVQIYTGYTLDRPFNRTSMVVEAVMLVREILVAGSVGIEHEFVPAVISDHCGEKKVNITPVIDEMRRIKDPDELQSIYSAIRLTEAGYAAVHGRIEPGLAEFEVYSMFHDALVRHAQTSVDLRGDFACGTRAIRGGGPPTARQVAAGDLYILDIFPLYGGYHCDLTRTFAVGPPTAIQQEAWDVVRQAHDLAAKLIRPGVNARDVYFEIRAHLETFKPTCGSFWHHLGHGLGMNGWEFPWLTPGSDHVIQEGEVLAVEPGLYGECLNGGIRLEHNYLVTHGGITALDSFHLDL